MSTYSENDTPRPRINNTKNGIINTIIGVRSAITGDEILYRLRNCKNEEKVKC
jgi:hypothetical protein